MKEKKLDRPLKSKIAKLFRVDEFHFCVGAAKEGKDKGAGEVIGVIKWSLTISSLAKPFSVVHKLSRATPSAVKGPRSLQEILEC